MSSFFVLLAVLFTLLALASLVFVIWAVVDAVRFTDAQWAAAGQRKVVWLLVIIGVAVIGCGGFGWIGALLYVLVPRPGLKRAVAR